MYRKFEELLKVNNVTAYQVAKATEISTATLTEWKKGTYTPKIDKLKKIADYFGIPVTEFLEDQEVVAVTDDKLRKLIKSKMALYGYDANHMAVKLRIKRAAWYKRMQNPGKMKFSDMCQVDKILHLDLINEL